MTFLKYLALFGVVLLFQGGMELRYGLHHAAFDTWQYWVGSGLIWLVVTIVFDWMESKK